MERAKADETIPALLPEADMRPTTVTMSAAALTSCAKSIGRHPRRPASRATGLVEDFDADVLVHHQLLGSWPWRRNGARAEPALGEVLPSSAREGAESIPIVGLNPICYQMAVHIDLHRVSAHDDVLLEPLVVPHGGDEVVGNAVETAALARGRAGMCC